MASSTYGAPSGGSVAIGGTVTSATEGSVLFAGPSSALAQDNTNLFFDDSANRLRVPNIAGGTGSAGTLTLKGTTHATPGPVIIDSTLQVGAAGDGVASRIIDVRNTSGRNVTFTLPADGIMAFAGPDVNGFSFGQVCYFPNAGITFLNAAASTTGFGYDTASAQVRLRFGGTSRIAFDTTGIGFFAATPAAKPTVTGAHGSNAALQSLLTGLATLGLITDSSS